MATHLRHGNYAAPRTALLVQPCHAPAAWMLALSTPCEYALVLDRCHDSI